MSLFSNNNIEEAFSWAIVFGKKIFRFIPKDTILIIIMNIISDISVLIAFLLPIKIILLLGSTSLPKYLPSSWSILSKTDLILVLSVVSITFYIFHIFAEKYKVYLTNKAIQDLLYQINQRTLSSNQNKLLFSTLQKFTTILSGIVFVIISFVVFIFLYFKFFMFLVSFSILAWIICIKLYEYNSKFRYEIQNNLNNTMKTIGAINFLTIFIFIIINFLFFIHPSIIVAILAIIIGRQSMGHLSKVVINLTFLYKNRLKINNIFYSEDNIKNDLKDNYDSFWMLLEKHRKYELVKKIFKHLNGNEKFVISWFQINTQDVISLNIEVLNEIKQENYIIKIFHAKKKNFFESEAIILNEMKEFNLPALKLLESIEYEGYSCHLFSSKRINKISIVEFRKSSLLLKGELLKIDIPKTLLSKYTESQLLLWDRIDKYQISRLIHIANKSEIFLINTYKKKLPCIKEHLKSLPIQIINHSILPENIVKDTENNLILLEWGKWSLEPIGTFWSTHPSHLKELNKRFQIAKNSRQCLNSIDIKSLYLSAYLSEFEVLYKKQSYTNAIQILKNIIGLVDDLQL